MKPGAFTASLDHLHRGDVDAGELMGYLLNDSSMCR
jgi:hypothetical protein